MSRVLIDSNIFVYAFDPADPGEIRESCSADREDHCRGQSRSCLKELNWTLLRRGTEFGFDLGEVQIVQSARGARSAHSWALSF